MGKKAEGKEKKWEGLMGVEMNQELAVAGEKVKRKKGRKLVQTDARYLMGE